MNMNRNTKGRTMIARIRIDNNKRIRIDNNNKTIKMREYPKGKIR
jgi:hypothetical protein